MARANSPARCDFFNVIVRLLSVFVLRLKRGVSGLAGADAHGVLEIDDEDFSVSDLAGLGSPGDGADDFGDLRAWNRDFDFDLRQEAHRVFGAPIDLCVPLLTPVAFDFGNSQSLHPD